MKPLVMARYSILRIVMNIDSFENTDSADEIISWVH